MNLHVILLAGAGTVLAVAVGVWQVVDEPGAAPSNLPRLAASTAGTAPSSGLRTSSAVTSNADENPREISSPVPASDPIASASAELAAGQPAPTPAPQPADLGASLVRQLVIGPKWVGVPAAPPSAVWNTATSLTLDLAPGVRQPIVLLEPDAGLPPPLAGALADIHNGFIERLEAAAGTGSDEDLAETWDREQTQADDRYRILFGEAAYQQMLMAAARNALGLPDGPVAPR